MSELKPCPFCGYEPETSVSMTRDVSIDIKTPSSIENTNPDYYKQELAVRRVNDERSDWVERPNRSGEVMECEVER